MQWNKPKSVRQIGEVPGRDRVYIEDYVVRFAKELAGQSRGMEKAAMLLGNTFLHNGEKIYQISGIVEISGFAGRSGPILLQDTWDRIYTEMKENFTDLEIVGWFFSCKGFQARQSSQLLEIHKQNFQHRDKVLYIYEETEKEDSFFLYRNGRFERQKGHYVYYEKNPEMLAYMEKESNRRVHIVEQEDDRVVRNIRGVMEEKEQLRERNQRKQKRESRLGYSLGSMVALIAIVIGVATLRNQNTLDQVMSQVERLQQMALGDQKENKTTVETMGSGLAKVTVDQKQDGADGGSVSGGAGTASGTAASGEAIQGAVAK